MSSYRKLELKLQQISHLNTIHGLAHWDKSVGLAGGSMSSRSEELASLSALIHEIGVSKEMGDLIASSKEESNSLDLLNQWQQKNLELADKNYHQQICLPVELQHDFEVATSQTEFAWRLARKNNDFNSLAPRLDNLFALTRQRSKILASAFAMSQHDVLIDSFDPGRRVEEIDQVFSSLKQHLVPLVQIIRDKQQSVQPTSLPPVDIKLQKKIVLRIIEKMGFNLQKGRVNESAHPFCSGSNDDVRLTVKYDESNLLFAVFAAIHETGHGLYQQSLPHEYRDQPVGAPSGMAFHESQSLIMENQIGCSRPFIEFLSKLLRDEFGLSDHAFEADNLYKIVTRVQPNLIRIEADEVTYPLHVILRYEIEKLILDNNFKAKDLPPIWNQKMQEYLGITPPTDSDGCMQDIHWQYGLLGYFPCYTNGALIASMIMQKIRQQHNNIDSELAIGSFQTMNEYLDKNLRSFGRLYDSADLLEKASGHRQIDPQIFIDYLQGKYI